MALLTGARQGELLRAEWRHIDYDRKAWLIPISKNGHARHVPLSQAAIDLLRTIPKKDGGTFLFPNPKYRSKPITTIKHSWDTARREAKIPDVRFHDLRHSAASFMIKAGVDLFTVGKVLGHKSYQSTQIYSHCSADKLLAAVEAGAKKLKVNWISANWANCLPVRPSPDGAFFPLFFADCYPARGYPFPADDAQRPFETDDIINLPNRSFYLRLMVDGASSKRSARTLRILPHLGYADTICSSLNGRTTLCRKCIALVFVLVSTLGINKVEASDSTSGQVVNPTMVNNGPVYFTQSGTRSTPPTCTTDPRWVIDNAGTGAANMYAAILSARMSGQKVIIQGTGVCLSGTFNETVAWVVIDG